MTANSPRALLVAALNHRSGQLWCPTTFYLLFLSPYSPELNPKETLWDEIRVGPVG
jgi:transposase